MCTQYMTECTLAQIHWCTSQSKTCVEDMFHTDSLPDRLINPWRVWTSATHHRRTHNCWAHSRQRASQWRAKKADSWFMCTLYSSMTEIVEDIFSNYLRKLIVCQVQHSEQKCMSVICKINSIFIFFAFLLGMYIVALVQVCR